MSFTEKRLCNPTQLTTSGQTLYTVPASKTAIIKQVVVTNVTGSAATFSLYIGSATAANALFSATSVAANDAIVINLSQVLNSTEILTALASANSTLNITISGVENDGPLNPLSTYIADGAITSAKIADGAIVNADINASAAIDKAKISGTAITAADTGTVTSTMILDGTIATGDIANNAVTQAKLASSLSGITVTTSALRATAVPSPFTGQTIYQTDNNQMLVWNGSAWVCITPVSATATNQLGTTSTSFVTLTSDPSVSIQTGTSALVTLSCRGVGLTAAGYKYTCFSISGATTRAASGYETQGITNYFGAGDLGNDRQASSTFLVTGLTAGVNTFQMQHAVSAGNYTVTGRSITVVGIP